MSFVRFCINFPLISTGAYIVIISEALLRACIASVRKRLTEGNAKLKSVQLLFTCWVLISHKFKKQLVRVALRAWAEIANGSAALGHYNRTQRSA